MTDLRTHSDLAISWLATDDASVLVLGGTLAATSKEPLLEALRHAPAAVSKRVIVDLSRVVGFDRPGAVSLLDAYVATVLRGGTISLRGVSAAARNGLLRAGVLDVMHIEPLRTPAPNVN